MKEECGLTWDGFNSIKLRVKLLHNIRSVLKGSLRHMTFPFPESKLNMQPHRCIKTKQHLHNVF